MGVLTVHHWTDRARGIAEMAHVARRVVVLYFESGMTDGLWLFDYWPAIHELTSEREPPGKEFFCAHLDVESIVAVPIAADCTDGFAGTFWSRPEGYLDRRRTEGMSSFAQLDDDTFASGAELLRADLESGAWDARYGGLRSMHEIDLGYRMCRAVRRPGSRFARRVATRAPEGLTERATLQLFDDADLSVNRASDVITRPRSTTSCA